MPLQASRHGDPDPFVRYHARVAELPSHDAIAHLERLAADEQDERLLAVARWARELAADQLATVRLQVGATTAPTNPAPPAGVTLGGEPTTEESPTSDAARSFRTRSTRRYVYLGELGRGGMARVLEVLDDAFNRRVAMKVVPADGTPPGHVQQFLHEAQVTAQLEHPGVIPVYDLGTWEHEGRSYLYYTMKPVRGRPLSDIVGDLHGAARIRAEGDRRGLIKLLRVVVAVCAVVDSAHAHGVLHRDLKPDNVMVGEAGEVYVVDWGIAAVRRDLQQEIHTLVTDSGRETRAEGVVGTPRFMAPEVLLGDAATEASDTWALGAILYAVLTGRAPYQGTGAAEILVHARAADPAPPSRVARGIPVPHEIDEICRHALTRDPTRRIATARTLHDRLVVWLDGLTDSERADVDVVPRVHAGIRHASEYLLARLATDGAEDAATRERAHAAAIGSFLAAERELHAALALDPTHADARAALADLFVDRLTRAEAMGAAGADDVAYWSARIAACDDGRHRRRLRGEGTLRITTEPPNARVRLTPASDGTGSAAEVAWEGNAPVLALAFPPGVWLASIEAPGRARARASIRVDRNRDAALHVDLPDAEDTPPGFVLVQGTEDPAVYLATGPVTVAAYAEFAHRTGRPVPAGTDASPASGVSFDDATAYAAWLTGRSGRPFRLARATECRVAGVDPALREWTAEGRAEPLAFRLACDRPVRPAARGLPKARTSEP